LSVICINVRMKMMAFYQLQKIGSVQEEQDRSKDRTLWHSILSTYCTYDPKMVDDFTKFKFLTASRVKGAFYVTAKFHNARDMAIYHFFCKMIRHLGSI